MTGPATLRAGHSHLFSGAWLRLDRPVDPPEEGEQAMVEFADGVAAPALLLPMPGPRLMLEVAEHVTARGTAMTARAWVLDRSADDPLALKIRQIAD